MNEERQRILQMLADGKITPEQADQLLDALGSDEPARSDEWSAPRQESRRPRERRRGDPTLRILAKASMHGVTSDYIAEMRAAGYGDLTLEQLISMRIHGVTSDFVRQMQQAGYSDLSAEDLIQLRISGVTPDYLREMRGLVVESASATEE